MPDVFLSYSREDQAVARRYAEGFEHAGFSVWWDQALTPGEAFDQVTEKALEEAGAVVVLWSKTSVNSRWVRAEATQANANGRLMPVMIESCKRPIMFELSHSADLSQWDGDTEDPAWQTFVAGVRRVVQRNSTIGSAPPLAATPKPKPDPDFHHDASRLVYALQRKLDPNAPLGRQRTSTVQRVESPRGHRPWMAALCIALAGMVAMLVPTLRHLRESPPPETRVDIVTPAATDDNTAAFALSPDGRQILFSVSGEGTSRLWLRSLATTTAQPLAGTEGAAFPFWSPDSRSIGFFADGALKRLDLGGGAPQVLVPVINGIGGTWNSNGVIVYSQLKGSPLMRVPASGGEGVPVTTIDSQQLAHSLPHFLPDGRRFLFYVQGASDSAGIYLGALDGSPPIRLTFADGSGLYSSGWLLWLRGGTLVAQRLDLKQAVLTGEPVAIATGVIRNSFSQGAFSAASGMVAYRTGAGGVRQLTWVDRLGTTRGTVGETDADMWSPNVAPDGRRIVVLRRTRDNTDLWMLEGGRTSRLTFDAAPDWYPLWSPDGTRIAFRSDRGGSRGDLYQKLMNGTGDEEQLLASDQLKVPSSWSADGRFLLFNTLDPRTSDDIVILQMEGERKPSMFLKTPFRERWGTFSPDGRWVAYQSNESGRDEIYLRPFVPPGEDASKTEAAMGSRQVSTAGGIYPLWSRDGKELYYLNPAGSVMAVPISTKTSQLLPGTPVELFPTRIVGGGVDIQGGRQYDITSDGLFLINMTLASALTPITLIQNWNPEGAK